MTAKIRHTHPHPMYTDTALFKIVSVITVQCMYRDAEQAMAEWQENTEY